MYIFLWVSNVLNFMIVINVEDIIVYIDFVIFIIIFDSYDNFVLNKFVIFF